MFKLEVFMEKRVLTSSLLKDENVIAFFTTRDLPLKAGERDDLIQAIEANKKLVCEGLNISLESLVIPQQTHSDNVEIVKYPSPQPSPPRGEGESLHNFSPLTSHFSPFKNTDALVTDTPNIALALNFADCVPIIFYDPVKKVAGAAHAGWRGTAAEIAPKTVDKMIENFNCKPQDIIALIGPAIGKCCFEVKDDVLAQIISSLLLSRPWDTLPLEGEGVNDAISGNFADLKLINKIQLLAKGIKKIDVCEYCTSCQNELFFSYRKENGKTARHSAVIMVNSEQ